MEQVSEVISMNKTNKINAVLAKCAECEPEHKKCGYCRLGSKSGVYKSDLVLALLEGYEKFGGGGVAGRTILTKAQQNKVFNDLKQGKSKKAIAEELGVSRGVIYRLLEQEKST